MTLKVLIVDDSSFFRKRLLEIISTDVRLEVIGTAEDGEQAIEQAKLLKPDIITMDIEMPKMDGITAVRHIMADCPTAILILSNLSISGAPTTFQALEAGAADYMSKRFEDIAKDQVFAQRKFCNRLYNLAINYRYQHTSALPIAKQAAPISDQTASKLASASVQSKFKLIAIGTSTGGPVALQSILSQLPASFPHPLMIIQHMPAAFTPSFAERLNMQCAIEVKQAKDGDVLLPGVAYIAPGGEQMLLKGTNRQPLINIQASKPEQTYRPCIDITFDSISRICPAETLAIILTGMGSDGKEGCQTLKKLKAVIWSQDEQSSTIYGMPMAIAKANLADKIFSLSDIGQQLSEIKV